MRYKISFETDLNATMSVVVSAKNRCEAIKILKKDYPSAFNIELNEGE